LKSSSFQYLRPTRLVDALAMLANSSGEAKVIAGGQSLVPAMNLRLSAPKVLVDLTGLEELTKLGLADDGSLAVGAMVTHSRMLHDGQVKKGWPVIEQVLPFVAHEQIRNRGTIGGSLCHADPAAEWAAICVLLDAKIYVQGPSGKRAIPASKFSSGVYETDLEPNEILTEVVFPPAPDHMRWGFHEISRRHGDFAMAGAIVGVGLDSAGRLTDIRLVVFAVEDKPRRIDADVSHCLGMTFDAASIDALSLSAASCVTPRSDLHASAELRSDLVYACVRTALMRVIGITTVRQV